VFQQLLHVFIVSTRVGMQRFVRFFCQADGAVAEPTIGKQAERVIGQLVTGSGQH